ncbi:DCC1-like thiol-disulfide oxidoreductase family protein [Flavobacterium caeni]|uniref:Predicted thiol-disulfide oxidoreductase YuxK, DCC family n=1 Tax=Flavobacterium caeni TaxID=490189 RepID=A0A1G5FGY3_9FLAO|nr:DCC1-like thiol-disulfide oxidoreductase family protein [Flavobacterium caeni]SCY38401.1 Predicted thiol-disulfide oxidoreductase YuxK, DCC family [Flavobacterium caeni]
MIKQAFRKLWDTKVDAIGLSVFRMCYAAVLFCEVLQLFKFRNLIYDAEPFNYVGDFDVRYLFGFWFVIIAMLFLGLFTRVTTIVNYLFAVVVFSSAINFEYHVFYAYVGINFLMMFMPVSRVFSLDSLIEKVKYTNIGRPYKVDRKVLEINYLAPVFLGIALVYFDSVFRKVDSPMWMDGLGMWLPSSLPHVVWTDTSLVLNQEWLVKFLGYLVVFFETIFIFLFWFKRFRVPFLLLGIFFHLGILIAYPIPWFALTAVVLYFLMVPNEFWLWISNKFKSKKQSFDFYYDAECPLCNKVVVIIKHFDVLNKVRCITVQGYAANEPALKGIDEETLLINIHGVDQKGKVSVGYDAYIELTKHLGYTYPIALLLAVPGISHLGKRVYRYVAGNRLTERCTSENCLMPEFAQPVSETDDFLVKGWNQLNLTKQFWKWLLVFALAVQLLFISVCPIIDRQINQTVVGKALNQANGIVHAPVKKYLGLTPHPVFMYNIHFDGYNHIFKIVCKTNQKRVPLLDDNGMVTHSYANGSMWVNHTFRTAAPVISAEKYEKAVSRYLRYFAHENGLHQSNYTIYVKEIETTDHWEHDFLHRQMEKPWKPAGTCAMTPTDVQFTWTPEMKAVFEAEKQRK